MAFAAAAPWIASAAGSLFSGLLGRKGQKDANEQNIALSREQMGFQERMSSTAHRREVADLKAAGLNPMLSATGGPGASSPTGSSARVENVNEPLERGVSSAAGAISQSRATKLALEQANANVNLTRQQIYSTIQARQQLEAIAPYAVSSAKGVAEGQQISNLSNAAILEGQKIEGDIDKSPLGTVLRYLNRVTGAVSGAGSVLRPGMGVRR